MLPRVVLVVRLTVAVAVVAPVIVAIAPAAIAQPVDRQVAEEPTAGVDLPATPLAGDHDARAVSVNPAGLHFLRGPQLVFALDLVEPEQTVTAGAGVGVFIGGALFGGLLPKLALGLGVEVLRPERAELLPDPGTPTRWSVATTLPLGERAALGLAWRRFTDDGVLDGVSTWDVGLAWRLGNHLAIGGVVRDLGEPAVPGALVQRRYELELTGRPLGTDRLDLGVGGRVGEIRGDLDGWLRGSVRVARGLYLHGAAETRALQVVETTAVSRRDFEERDWRLTAGVEVSFGGSGVTAYGAAAMNADRDVRFHGGTLIGRISAEPVAPIQGRPGHIERIDLTGELDARAILAVTLRLRAIGRDASVVGVVVALDDLGSGWGTLAELRGELIRLRGAGKKVFAYMVSGTSRDYFVATAADKIYVDPAGGIRLTGFAGTTMYFRGVFDELGVQAQFEKIAEYKSAPESYTDTGPSEPALRMRNTLYDSLADELIAAIAEGRHLDRSTVHQLIDRGPYSAGDLAKDRRLVDAVGEPERIAELVAIELGGVYPVLTTPGERPDRWELPTIAVIIADGDIVDGRSQTIPLLGRKLVGGETIAAAIAAARVDPDVDAILLRIDSAGGSALASELMSREVFATRGVKPIVCSMGDLAASGGYFLAAGCDTIFASKMTITGSIGIFYGKFDVSGLLAKLGVTTETFRRGARADMESFYRPYTDEERAVILDKLRYLYGRFTGAVAKGRGLTEAQVDAVGRGQVWSGSDALGRKLIDRHGSLGDALAYTREQIGLGERDRARIVVLPRVAPGLLGTLLGLLGASASGQASAPSLLDLPAARAILDAIPPSMWLAPSSAQARLPFTIRWD